MQNTLYVKENVKKDANKVAFGIIIYTVITISVIFLGIIGEIVVAAIQNPEFLNQSDEVLEQFFYQFLENGTYPIIGGILGVLFLIVFLEKKSFIRKFLFSKDKYLGRYL